MVIDHLGNTYINIKDMLKLYNIDIKAFKARITRGNSLEYSLTKEKRVVKYSNALDHLGNTYNSLREMCHKYGINEQIYWSRVFKYGYSVEKSLTCKNLKKPIIEDDTIIDYLGNEYKTFGDMCNHYGIRPGDINRRLEEGNSLQRCFEFYIDYKGNTFVRLEDMCKKYGMEFTKVFYRIQGGYSIEKTLTYNTVAKSKEDMKHYDYLGNVYKTLQELCDKYKVLHTTFIERLKRGYSLEAALINDLKPKEEYKDHKGNVFNSLFEMCCFYGIDNNLYRKRRNDGWTLEKVLTTPIGRRRR